MKLTFHPAESRGGADHGWLKARHSFSFAGWFDPERVHFGALRVLNDDWISPSTGFGIHPHDNMEIVTIPLTGAIRHKDSFGNEGIIRAGEIQVMSAGKGIYHSEMNPLTDEATTLLQIWVMPELQNTEPWYNQSAYSLENMPNTFVTLVSGFQESNALPLGQKARFSMASLKKGMEVPYQTQQKGQGIYFFLIEGKVSICDQTLEKRDALGIQDEENLYIKAEHDALLLAIEVPMQF